MPLSGIGFGEMMVIAMLVLIVFGPHRLPEITRQVGKAMREFKRGMNEIQRELEVADRQKRWSAPATPEVKPPTPGTPQAAAAAAGAAASATGTEDASAEMAVESNEAGATGSEAESTEPAAGQPAANQPAAGKPEPTIAPPMFGSELPDEIESQLGPPPTETAYIPPKPPPEVADDPNGSGAPEPDESGASEPVAAGSAEGQTSESGTSETQTSLDLGSDEERRDD